MRLRLPLGFLVVCICGVCWGAGKKPLFTRSCAAALSEWASLGEREPQALNEDGLSEKAIRNLTSLLEEIFGKPESATSLPIPSDPLQLQSRIILKLATLAGPGKFNVPRPLLKKIEEDARQRQLEIRDLETAIALEAEKLGEAYRPMYYVEVVNVLEEFRQSTRVMAGPSGFFEPLVRIIYSNSMDFLAVISKSVMLDEAQAQTLNIVARLIKNNQVDLSDPGVRFAVEDLLVANLRDDTDALRPKTHAFLRSLGPLLSENDRTLLTEDLSELESDLNSARASYGSHFYAASICYHMVSAITRPGGNPVIDPASPLNDARITRLDDHPYVRELGLAALADQRSFIDPLLNEKFDFDFDPRKALIRYGAEKIDPILVRQLDTGRRRTEEYFRALKQARRQELSLTQAMVSEATWNKRQAKLASVAKKTIVDALRAPVARGIPAPIIATLVEHLEDRNSPVLQQKRGTESLPLDLAGYLNFWTVRAPSWNPEAFSFTKEFRAEVVPGATPPIPQFRQLPNSGEAYTYLLRMLSVLDDRAKDLVKGRDETRRYAMRQLKSPAAEELGVWRFRLRELLELVAQVSHAFNTYFLYNGRTETEGQRELGFHLGENFPTLAELIAVHATQPALTGLRRQICIHAVRSAFLAEESKMVPDDQRFSRNPFQLIWKHKIKAAISAGVIGAGAAAWYLWPMLFSH